jgi:hypothetical protein
MYELVDILEGLGFKDVKLLQNISGELCVDC